MYVTKWFSLMRAGGPLFASFEAVSVWTSSPKACRTIFCSLHPTYAVMPSKSRKIKKWRKRRRPGKVRKQNIIKPRMWRNIISPYAWVFDLSSVKTNRQMEFSPISFFHGEDIWHPPAGKAEISTGFTIKLWSAKLLLQRCPLYLWVYYTLINCLSSLHWFYLSLH